MNRPLCTEIHGGSTRFFRDRRLTESFVIMEEVPKLVTIEHEDLRGRERTEALKVMKAVCSSIGGEYHFKTRTIHDHMVVECSPVEVNHAT